MGADDKVIVFFGKKARVDAISSELALQGVNCQSIHGSREQSDREQALDDLRSGEVKILLATDVASRGIDIEDVTYVLIIFFWQMITNFNIYQQLDFFTVMFSTSIFLVISRITFIVLVVRDAQGGLVKA